MKRTVFLTVETKPDKLGRQRILAQWPANNIGKAMNETGLRGQFSFTVLKEEVQYWEQKGYTVKVKKQFNLK